MQHFLSVSAAETLDLTATFTLMEAISTSKHLMKRLQSLARNPQQLEVALDGSLHERGWGYASVCWLQNDTGTLVLCWLAPAMHPEPKKPGAPFHSL